MPPRVIGQYEILSVLGAGGIGCVYRAFDRRTGDDVALKLLSSGPALDALAARRMAREFEALYELTHDNVVRVFDTGVYRGYPYLAMELIEGLNLREYLAVDVNGMPMMLAARRKAAMSPAALEAASIDDSMDASDPGVLFGVRRNEPESDSEPGLIPGEHVSGFGPEALRQLADAIDEPLTDDDGMVVEAPGPAQAQPAAAHEHHPSPDLKRLNRPERIALLKDSLLQICEALAYVHARGMVHRDLKPSNIMVDEDRRVKLMDFGLAKFLAEESAVTAAGRIVGTYRYMAPEQLLGEPIDGRTDLYSLGVMLYELLVGTPPFDAKTPIEMCHQVLELEPMPLLWLNPELDEQLTRVTHRLMKKDPDERFQTAEEVYEVLAE